MWIELKSSVNIRSWCNLCKNKPKIDKPENRKNQISLRPAPHRWVPPMGPVLHSHTHSVEQACPPRQKKHIYIYCVSCDLFTTEPRFRRRIAVLHRPRPPNLSTNKRQHRTSTTTPNKNIDHTPVSSNPPTVIHTSSVSSTAAHQLSEPIARVRSHGIAT